MVLDVVGEASFVSELLLGGWTVFVRTPQFSQTHVLTFVNYQTRIKTSRVRMMTSFNRATFILIWIIVCG